MASTAYASIDDLRSQLGRAAAPADSASAEAYAAKMLHKVPDAPVLNRAAYLLEHTTGLRVLEFGASGPMHEKIKAAAASYMGVDRDAVDRVVAFDLDDVHETLLPAMYDPGPDVIICGEVLEHLSNPGWFLTRLRRQFSGIPTIITVPNAFCDIGRSHTARGTENVNIDHVAWYSYRTLKTLLNRAGYINLTFGWYGGKPMTAEGLIVLTE